MLEDDRLEKLKAEARRRWAALAKAGVDVRQKAAQRAAAYRQDRDGELEAAVRRLEARQEEILIAVRQLRTEMAERLAHPRQDEVLAAVRELRAQIAERRPAAQVALDPAPEALVLAPPEQGVGQPGPVATQASADADQRGSAQRRRGGEEAARGGARGNRNRRGGGGGRSGARADERAVTGETEAAHVPDAADTRAGRAGEGQPPDAPTPAEEQPAARRPRALRAPDH
ncbi:MAG TPA: hypothetical protein VKV25_09145 [Acidimicrobiales bacterium]|nr:hypothetical protein [Acidimicrobiales bacterium]